MMISNKVENIVILNHHATAPDTGGGGRHYELGKSLSEAGHNVCVLASSYDNGKKEYLTYEKVNEVKFSERFKFIRFKTAPSYKSTLGRFLNYINYKNYAGAYSNFGDTPTIIIASSVHPLAWIAGYKLSKKYNAKFIVEVRDLWPLTMYEDFSGLKRKLVFSYLESLEKKYYRLADAIITTAPFAFEYIESKYNIDKSKVHYIPHGIDIEKFDDEQKMSDDILSEELSEVLNSYFCVTYTGALSKSEGLSTFVKSAKLLEQYKDIKLVVVGGGPEKNKLEKIIEENKLENVIIFGKQPRKYIPLILKKSKILFCGLMDREAFKYGISKNKFYDYMASNKPIIFCSNVRGSLITKAGAGVTIKPGNSENLAENIISIYNNYDNVGEKFGSNGRRFAEENHTVKIVSDQFLNVISHVK
ncbi:glycosyltransferase family 4 protein [Halobacillus locisalis]|uniref:Glycosyltransferase family 4 protein n=1 Tax=Halobacillus locisalis TaxID=220753 RepID=A0A838CTP8_9BACI|nr:glycosyltransferase family 4 protein [Halobacillus locisalis]MBA2175360.1 glycosyltransferase family 4 protein [Halobacillus locisalis]